MTRLLGAPASRTRQGEFGTVHRPRERVRPDMSGPGSAQLGTMSRSQEERPRLVFVPQTAQYAD